MCCRWLLASLVLLSATVSFAEPPTLYPFCMELFDSQKRSLPEQAQMLRDLGFPGVGYPLWLDGSLEKNLQTLDAAGLKLFMAYASLDVNPEKPPFDPALPEAIAKLKGRPVTVCVLLSGLPPHDPRGEQTALKTLRILGDRAAAAGVRISVYHHTGEWAERFLDTAELVRKLNHPQVGVNFNLCHWLKVDGDKDYRPLLRQHVDRIFTVTISGAKRGSDTWTNGLIQPLDEGDFDLPELLAVLRQAGYRGPIGLQCYGIPGDARQHLERSLRVWRQWTAGGEVRG